MLYSNFLRK